MGTLGRKLASSSERSLEVSQKTCFYKVSRGWEKGIWNWRSGEA